MIIRQVSFVYLCGSLLYTCVGLFCIHVWVSFVYVFEGILYFCRFYTCVSFLCVSFTYVYILNMALLHMCISLICLFYTCVHFKYGSFTYVYLFDVRVLPASAASWWFGRSLPYFLVGLFCICLFCGLFCGSLLWSLLWVSFTSVSFTCIYLCCWRMLLHGAKKKNHEATIKKIMKQRLLLKHDYTALMCCTPDVLSM